MATSGSFDFSLNRNEIITEALRNIAVLADGATATAAQISDGQRRLNMMLKAWRNRGISLPLYQELVVFLSSTTASYNIGATGNNATTLSDFVKTELSADAAAGASSFTVDSITGIAASDVLGIELDDGTIQWTTVNGAPSGSTITPAVVLTGAASTDNHVYAYTSIAQRPLTVKGARLRREDGKETPVRIVTREEYFGYVDKTATSEVTAVYYDPQITNGVLYTYPTTDNVKDVLLLTVQRQLADMDNSTDDFDLPAEWLEAIAWNLSKRMLTKYGIDAETSAEVKANAIEFLMDAEDFDMEDYIEFTPANEYYE